jgi:HEPN domain-containing protein
MTERPRIEDLVRPWVIKAEHDLLNIENNLSAKVTPWDTVGFHAQQCAEKYLWRYPGVWEPVERDEALRAVEAARAVRDAVRRGYRMIG